MDGPLVIILTLLAWFVPLSIIASGYIRIIYSVKSNLFSPRQDNVISAEVDRARRVREFSFFIYRMMHYYTNFPFLRARPPSKMEGLPLEFIITLGTIHLRRRHSLGGEGSKICQICRRIVVKNCRR